MVTVFFFQELMRWQRCTPHAWSPRAALSLSSLLPLRLISSVIPRCGPSPLLVTPTVSISRNVQADSLSYAVPDAHGRDQPREGWGPKGSGAVWGGLARPDSRRARSWQTHRQPVRGCLNLIICQLPSGCRRTMYSARKRTWVCDRDSLGLLHTPLDTVTRASGSDTAL